MKHILFFLVLIFTIAGVAFAQEKDKGKKETKELSSKLPEGYGTIPWGTPLSKARKNVVGKLIFTDEKTEIITRDGDLEYHYGFFYIDPAISSLEKGEAVKSDKAPAGNEEDEGNLFFVSLKFPYLLMKDVKKKIEDKYGPSVIENLVKNQGAIAWESEKTIIVMWVDRYEKMPFCRRITYLSKDIAKQLNDYQMKVFNKMELELIKKLNP